MEIDHDYVEVNQSIDLGMITDAHYTGDTTDVSNHLKKLRGAILRGEKISLIRGGTVKKVICGTTEYAKWEKWIKKILGL
jgi:hypothetical protein